MRIDSLCRSCRPRASVEVVFKSCVHLFRRQAILDFLREQKLVRDRRDVLGDAEPRKIPVDIGLDDFFECVFGVAAELAAVRAVDGDEFGGCVRH